MRAKPAKYDSLVYVLMAQNDREKHVYQDPGVAKSMDVGNDSFSLLSGSILYCITTVYYRIRQIGVPCPRKLCKHRQKYPFKSDDIEYSQ